MLLLIAIEGAMQMVMTTTLGFLQMYLPLGFYTAINREGKPPNFWRNMLIVGVMRYSVTEVMVDQTASITVKL